jgi:hypothetical protein
MARIPVGGRVAGLLTIALLALAPTALAANPKLYQAQDLFDSGAFAKARDAFRLLASDPGLTEADRAHAQLYLAASEFSLGEAEAARKDLKTLAIVHPEVRADPNVFLPEFVTLAETVRKEAEASEPGHKHHRRAPPETATKVAPVEPRPEEHPMPTTSPETPAAPIARPEQPVTPNLTPSPPPPTTELQVSAPAPEPKHSSRRTWAYVGYGVAGAAAIVSGLFYLQAKSSAQDAAKATDSPDYLAKKSSVDSKLRTSNFAGISAAVVAGGATVLLVTSF